MRRAAAGAADGQDSSDLVCGLTDVVVDHDCVELLGTDPLLGLGPSRRRAIDSSVSLPRLRGAGAARRGSAPDEHQERLREARLTARAPCTSTSSMTS